MDAVSSAVVVWGVIHPTNAYAAVIAVGTGLLITAVTVGNEAILAGNSMSLKIVLVLAVSIDFLTTVIGAIYYVGAGMPLSEPLALGALVFSWSKIPKVMVALAGSAAITGSSVVVLAVFERASEP